MLPRAHRLRRSAEFAQVVRRGSRAGSSLLVLHGLDRADGDPSRVGFVVSRSVGDAVTRNRVRRRLRELVRDRLPEIPPHASVVVRVLPAAAGQPSAALGRALDASLGALGSRIRRRGVAS